MTTTLATDTFASRTVSGSFGTGSDGQIWQTPFNNTHAIVAVGSGEGSVYYDNISGGIGRYETIYGTLAARDANITARFQFGSTSGSADFRLYLRYIDANNWSQIRITPTTIFYRHSIGGTVTATTAGSFTFAANVFYRARFVFNQSSYSITWWQDGNSEPSAQFTSTDTNVPWAGYFGVGLVATGITSGTAMLVDSFVVTLVSTVVNPIYWVDGASGSDSNDGSSAHPWATLQYAMYSAILGATIIVRTATYTQPSNTPLINRVSGTAAQPITFISLIPFGAAIVGTGMLGLNTNAYVTWNQGDYVNYVGFDITGDGRIGINNDHSYCAVKLCRIHDIPAHLNTSGGGGIDHANTAATGNSSIGNLIFNIGEGTDNGVHGIYQANPFGVIQNNICLSNSGMGINLDHNPSNCVVTNNLAGSNKSGGIWIGGIGFTADFNYVANNIVRDNTGSFGALYESSGVGTNNQYRNNCLYNNANTFNGTPVAIQAIEVTNGQYTGNFTADPQHVNYLANGTGDYHLQSTSPCRDAGINTNAPTTDYDGNARPLGTSYDIGPLEYGYTGSMSDGEILWDMDQSDAGGGVWRYTDGSNFYQVTVNDASSSSGSTNLLTIYKTVGGVRSSLVSSAIAFTRGMYRRFKVTMIGGVITAYMDGVQVCTYTDGSPLSAGKTGLNSDSGANNRFYQFRVQPYGDMVSSHIIQTRLRLASTNPQATPQVADLSLVAFGNTIQAGANIPQTKMFHKYIDQNINDLAKASNFWAYFDKNKVAYFLARDGIPAPWIASSTPGWVDSTGTLQATFLDAGITVEDSSDLYRNRQIIDNVLASTTINENRKGDSVLTSWTFGNQWAGTPTITVNGVVASVGVKNVDTGKQFYYAVGDETIIEDGSGPVYDNSFTINFSGPGQYLTYSQADNTTEQAALAAIDHTSGIVVNVEDGTGLTKAQGDALAQDRLNQYGVRGRLLKATTRRSGLAPGQLLPVFLPEHNIFDGLFLVRQVVTYLSTEFGVQQGIYTIEAISGPDIGDWMKLYQRT
jgi:hypothetical protein